MVRFVVLDLGDVVCRFDPEARRRALERLTGRSAVQIHQAIWGSGLDERAERREIDAATLPALLGAALDVDIDPGALRAAWSLAFEPNDAVLTLIDRLAVPAVLFTNNGPRVSCCLRHELSSVQARFSHVFLSWELSAVKPEPAAYAAVVTSFGVDAAELFFADDSQCWTGSNRRSLGAMTTARTLGHLALYYRPGDMEASRRLLQDLGCTLVENGPRPGEDGFCTVLVDDETANHADNILFLAPVSPKQEELERAIREQFVVDAPSNAPATAFTDMKRDSPETASHFAIRYREFDELENVLRAVEGDTAEGGPLHGRVELTKYRARPDLDPAVDERMAASPAFTGDEPRAFADYWVQCFVKTDLFGYGILAFGQTIELDFVFEPFFRHPPSFGRAS